MDSMVIFGHERLVAFERASEFLAAAADVIRGLPRGESNLADQLRRAGDSVLLNLAEGAGRTAPLEKARFYDIARGSGAECGAALTICAIRRLAAASLLERARRLLDEVLRLLTALARSARRRGVVA